jgi:outer membrane protein assembly factor BamA
MRRSIVVFAAILLVEGAALRAQEQLFAKVPPNGAAQETRTGSLTIRDIRFDDLRRISPEALRMRLESRAGEALDSAKLDHDVRSIARLGWFTTVRAEIEPVTNSDTPGQSVPGLRLVFCAQESPFLTVVTYRGSRLLSPQQIEKFLVDQKLKPKLGEPENLVALNLAARAIESALADLAHPRARVRVVQEPAHNATERVRFEIDDGPLISVGRVTFQGNSGVSARTLRHQMRSVAPEALFASLRGKNAYTPAAFEADRSQLLSYLSEHGYPQAQVGAAEISEYEEGSHWRWPWYPKAPQTRFAISIPIEAGSFDAQNTASRRARSSIYTVRRLEFVGLRRFPDRYLRSRIGIAEGAPFDEHTLEAGLRRLARTGYFKPIKRNDVSVQPDEASRTVNVAIHVQESGQQRLSLDGGRGQFGSTLGFAYSLFNVLDREELLTSKIECGPETLQLAIGLAMEGFLGSRAGLALSVFDTFLRPRLSGEAKGPFFHQRSEGVNAIYRYAISNVDALSAEYIATNSVASYSSALSSGMAGIGAVQMHSSSSSVAFGWTRDRGVQQVTVTNSVSGGVLGGSENLVRAKLEYARLVRDPLFNSENAWALRTTFNGVGSYSGNMPITSRFFAGDAYVRGLNDGDLGPLVIASSSSLSGATKYSAMPSGANMIGAANAEYRWRIGRETEVAGFFDLGSGRLLPNWLGPSRPSLFDSTNGQLRGSTGLELRWTLPGIGVPLRGYYAVNILRPDRLLRIPDGSLFHLHTQWSTLGWGLGPIF